MGSTFEPFEIALSADNESFGNLEALLLKSGLQDVALREADPADPVLRSTAWLTIVLAVSSAGGVKAVKDVLVAYLENRRVTLTVRTGRDKVSTIEGPLGREQVERLVSKILDQ